MLKHIIHNIQKAIQMSIGRWMDKQNVLIAYTYNGILLIFRK